MSSSKRSQSSGRSSTQTRIQNRVTQASADAKLSTAFEVSSSSGGDSFDYTKSVTASLNPTEPLAAKSVTAYLQRMQRGSIIQSFGCMMAVEPGTFRIIAYSENVSEMLGVTPQSVPTGDHQNAIGIGTDVRSLLSPSSVSVVEKAVAANDVSMMNPIAVYSLATQKLFFAILHMNDVGLVIDLEPISSSSDSAMFSAGAVQSHKLAAKAISRLQSLPGGDICGLCDVVVEEVRELTGYDRVMAYKFHDDEHGEVVAEIRRSDLEPYLGLHYPATDIPQASRFLFIKNRIRMICDCTSPQVKVVQDSRIPQEMSLAGSTMRGVHGCHTQYMMNMGSTASLVMSVTINDTNEIAGGPGMKGRKLWGLIVCHHSTPRHIPFPIRSACEFLMQVFGLQLNMEVELAAQHREKHILRTQTLLCDMLLRDAPMGIVSQSPNVMDLVKCDGAALLFGGRCWLLGISPTQEQVKDIATWLISSHTDTTGLSTDSLVDAGYPKARELGVDVCGMAAARITENDFLFWFRGHAQKEVKWAGAKDGGSEEDGSRMHPRSSFKAFLEVVKQRSLPWEDVEMDAIHSLQLILRGSFQDIEDKEDRKIVHARLKEMHLQGMEELSSVASEMVRLIETATAPILAVDTAGCVNGWNFKISELTGLSIPEVMGKSLVKDLTHPSSKDTVEKLLYMALNGEEEQNVEIRLKTWGMQQGKGPVILMVNACASRDVSEKVVGVCFVAQDVTGEKIVQDKFTRIQGDYTTIVRSHNSLIPPIFGSDESGFCVEWNPAMERLSGVKREEAIGKMLTRELFGGILRLKNVDGLTKFMIVLNAAMSSHDTDKFPFTFYDRSGKIVEVLLTTSKRCNSEGVVTGVFCFLHTASSELQQALTVQKAAERVAEVKAKELAYIRQEIQNPLDGIHFARSFMEHTVLSEDQKQLIETSATCEKQLRRILADMDLASIEKGYLELETGEFSMATVMNSVVSQGMIQSTQKNLQLYCDTPPDFKSLSVFGDQVRLQQVLADFLLNAVQFTPPSGWVEIKVEPVVKKLPGGVSVANVDFRVSHPGEGLPEDLIDQMFDRADARVKSQEGLGLSICRKLVRLMNGEVQYRREGERNFFLLQLELPLAQRDDQASMK
uniref:Phytochrome n=1 Tax=Mougeotia scalaris TaxID=13158 RepID=PHY_MOUSC|nr:RecName: Full=Phytochrome [Mougeotia scalaris]CAA64796.1 phytochrome [Mougeotia scalaris]